MNTIEQSEHEAADAITDYALQLVKNYCPHPGDIEAAMVAVLVSALEKIVNKEIYIEKLYDR